MTSDSRLAKIRAAKIYLDYAACLHIIALKMRDALNSLNCRSAREEALVSAAFELGREFEQEKQALEAKLQSLKKEFDEKLKNLFLNIMLIGLPGECPHLPCLRDDGHA